jgi:hypothetical protein
VIGPTLVRFAEARPAGTSTATWRKLSAQAEGDRARRDRDEVARTLEKAEARWIELDAADQDLTLGALCRARTDLEHAETRLAATDAALEAVPTEAPTDALLDFAAALQRALRGVDTSGSMAQVNTELATIFEGFLIWPGDPVYIEPVVHEDEDIAVAILQGVPAPPGMTRPLIAPSEAPPMKWFAAPYRNSDYAQAYRLTKPNRPAFAASQA